MKLGIGISIFKLFVVINNFFGAATDQENSQYIETHPNEKYDACKLFDLFNLGHHIWNPEKDSDSGKNQCNAPRELNNIPGFQHWVIPISN